MLSIDRMNPRGSSATAFLDAVVSLRKDQNSVENCPDLDFSIRTYERISKVNADEAKNVGDLILLPINLFFETLSFRDQLQIYKLYAYARKIIPDMTMDNRLKVQDDLQKRIFNLIHDLNLAPKIIAFCKTDVFTYPNLDEAGTLPHHSPAKTFQIQDYVEITAISLLSKLLVPIWGEFIRVLSDMEIDPNQREKIAFDLVEASLEETAFERIYAKLTFTLTTLVTERRKLIDGKTGASATTSSFIMTHNGIDDQMFYSIVMAIIVVKRMATYECLLRKDNNIPNAMVYIDDGIKRTADTKIQGWRNHMNTMPRRELSAHDTEDNSSILDHASKTSKKPIDVPVLVVVAAENWELKRLVESLNTPMDVFNGAVKYYATNGFEVSPLCQAMVASFVGDRFGGSKPINYLTPLLYQQLVILLQIYLIKEGFIDLAALVSSKTSALPIDGAVSHIAGRIETNLKTSGEVIQCQKMFKGHLKKPANTVGRRVSARKQEMDTIDFNNHIARMKEWLVRYNHEENMAPVLWKFSKVDTHAVAGQEARFSETVLSDLCRFYLMFHNGNRPF